MTILGKYKKHATKLRTPWKRKIDGLSSEQSSDFIGVPITSPSRPKGSPSLIKLNILTMKAMKIEVDKLITHSIQPVTGAALASALAVSQLVTNMYANPENENELDNIMGQIKSLKISRRRQDQKEVLERRYALTNCLNFLGKLPESQIRTIASWKEAVRFLSQIFVFPEGDEKDADEIESELDKYEAAIDYKITKERTPVTMKPSYIKWKQVARVTPPMKLYRNRLWDDARENALLLSQLKEAVLKPPNNINVINECEERLRDEKKEMEAKKRVSSLMRTLSNEEPTLFKEKEAHLTPHKKSSVNDKVGERLRDEKKEMEAKKRPSSLICPLPDKKQTLLKNTESDLKPCKKSKDSDEVEQRLHAGEKEMEAKKWASSLMSPLSLEDQTLAHKAIHGTGPKDEVVAKCGTESVQRQSMHTLQPGAWVGDEIISYFFLMLSKRDEEMCKKDRSKKRCHFFKSFFFTKLLNEGNQNCDIEGKYDYNNVKSWSKHVPGKDIFKLDKIVFAINQSRSHWICAVAFITEKRIQMYDSLASQDPVYVNYIFRYIQDEHFNKKNKLLPDIDQWKVIAYSPDTPRQTNGTYNILTNLSPDGKL